MTKHYPAICEECGTIVQTNYGILLHRQNKNCFADFLPMLSKDKRIQKKIKEIQIRLKRYLEIGRASCRERV